jgi:threonine dehydrogenase-like Zn-dependent dehydrogenase
MGHEFTGIVIEIGSEVKTIERGDLIVCPFTTSWYVLDTGWTDSIAEREGIQSLSAWGIVFSSALIVSARCE